MLVMVLDGSFYIIYERELLGNVPQHKKKK